MQQYMYRWSQSPSHVAWERGYRSVIPCPSLLVRSQFPPPVFDRLQYANTVGEAGDIWSRAVTSGRQRVNTQGAVPNRNKRTVLIISFVNALTSSFRRIVQKGPLTPMCLHAPDGTACVHISQAFPRHISIYSKRSNTGRRNGLGMRLVCACSLWHKQ